MDDIRAKRLSKLDQNSQESSKTSAESEAITSTSLQSSTASTPALSDNAEFKKPKTDSPVTQPDIYAWAAKELAYILGVTLDPESTNQELTFLESTFAELVEENQDPVFNREIIDRAIIERLSEIGVDNPFRYLKSSWEKTLQTKRLIKLKDPLREQKLDILNELDRLTSSYGLVSFQIPDMFQNGDVTHFLKDIISNENQYSEFLIQILNRAQEEGTILEFLNIFVPGLSKLILDLDLNNPQYPLILNIFQLLLNEKSVAAVFTQIEGFKLSPRIQEPSKFEVSTILGPIFRLSPLQPSVAQTNFDRTTEKSKLQIKQIGESLQSEHKVLLDRLFFIVNKIVRGSETSRNDLLEYFATIINKNHLRRGDHADFNKLSSNAFMVNISLIFIRLSQPFLDPSFTKIEKVDLNYFSKSKLVDLTEETRTNSTSAQANEFFEANKSEEKPNFISDCFFITLAYLQYGIGGTILTETKLKQKIKSLEDSVDQVNRSANSNNPLQRFAAMQLPRLKKSLADIKSQKDALVSFFVHRDLQLEIFDFVAGASAFLIRAVDPNHKFPQQQISLPLIPDVIGVENADNSEYFREKSPSPFKYFPEYVVEGVVNYVQYISKYIASPLIMNPRLTTFVEFAVVFLRCPELIGNPHLKGRLVEALFIGSLPTQDDRPGFMIEIFDTNEIVTNHLLYALLEFYVVVEKTGSSSQFYDKFNSRYHISLILEQLWKNPHYRNQLIYQSEQNEEFFIRFVARMLNDLTFLLDESLRQLAEIHKIQVELERRQRGASDMEGTNEELAARLISAEAQSRSYGGLANKSIDLFGIFTKDIPRAFIKPEIVGRLANMLNYNLDALVGPKCTDLKVKDPEKYQFNPKSLLLNISKVFVNLADEEEFVDAVAQDSRSFKRSLFTRAEGILRKWALASNEFINKLVYFANMAESKRLSEEEEEQELGEVPDEFLDPLMYTLMKDPVTLPSSKVNIDRSTIKAHLLSDSTDPFNRMPLKLEDVTPNEELKKQIEEFKRGKKDVKMSDV